MLNVTGVQTRLFAIRHHMTSRVANELGFACTEALHVAGAASAEAGSDANVAGYDARRHGGVAGQGQRRGIAATARTAGTTVQATDPGRQSERQMAQLNFQNCF